jgi:hypothetical protein
MEAARLILATILCAAATPVLAASWTPATGNLANLPSECGNLCHVFPVPNSGDVIAGVAGAGLWITHDLGTNWNKMSDTGPQSAAIRNRPQQILYDPTNNSIFWETGIYTGPGVVKTTNGGHSFSRVGIINHVDALGIDFSDPGRLTMIATGHETDRALHKSTDGGITFTDIGTNLPKDAGMTSSCFVFDARTYVVGTWGWGKPGGIWRTTDGGSNWTRVSDLTPTPGGSMLRTRSGHLFCGSQNGNALLKGTAQGESWSSVPATGARSVSPIELPGNAIATLGKDGIMISGDEGATWRTIATGLPIPRDRGVTVGGLAYNPAAAAVFVWFWDCGNVVRPDAVWRYDIVLPAASEN